ncbi:hypothetical protein Vadar_031443 [Vaccinium darrowii]|uniref:Uncharacterized protein n=1 Tax=Vaccinium darrowii TaxID=229202 RepID=A0ACB7Z7F8_9ERIC|nr:hypothetical protein Vadar_031443 [Vaccinium darrowii]
MEISVNSTRSVPVIKSSIEPKNVAQSHPAHFHPSVWGDHFLTYGSDVKDEADVKMKEQRDQLKGKVRNMLMEDEKPLQKLNLIDAIQRLGVAYHFQAEIESALQHMYETYQQNDHKYANDDDLYTAALWFRLLRQEGYPISCDVFNKFMDNSENIQESVIDDVRGMLSLYEATHLRVHGEVLLDKALDFATTNLKSAIPKLSNNVLAAQVAHALNQPIHKGLTRLESRRYISFYERDDTHNKVLLDFAKMDFNLLQKLHQMELREITMWWKDLDFARKTPFARDRVVESYFWAMGVYFEPQYSFARKVISQSVALFAIVDDIYDSSNASLEELELFTDTIQRWEITASDQLPEYMKLCYQALFNFCTMIGKEMAKKGRSYCVNYAKSAIKGVARAYFGEVKWCHEGYVPHIEEYMRIALVSCCYKMFPVLSFVGMGELATKEAFDWVSNDPLMVQAATMIARLTDDMADHKFEKERKHASAVKCYMKKQGATEEKALAEFQNRLTNACKDMNSEGLRPTAVPMPLLVRVLNLARVIHVLYKDEDTYTRSGTKLKDDIASVLIDSLPIN